jgi:hypothetical protein
MRKAHMTMKAGTMMNPNMPNDVIVMTDADVDAVTMVKMVVATTMISNVDADVLR